MSVIECFFQVFDRLQPLGICLSYYRGLVFLDSVSGHFNSLLIEWVRKKKRLVDSLPDWFALLYSKYISKSGKDMCVLLFIGNIIDSYHKLTF